MKSLFLALGVLALESLLFVFKKKTPKNRPYSHGVAEELLLGRGGSG